MDISRAKGMDKLQSRNARGRTNGNMELFEEPSEYLPSTTISQSHDKSTNYRNNRNGWVTSNDY